jgi:predicted ABC-type ATPase
LQTDRTKDVVVIGGPNGAGKTTWAYRNLAPTLEIREFVNADEIARGLSPFNPEAGAIPAGRVMLNRLNDQPTLSRAGTRLVSAICATSTCRLLIWLLFTTIPTVMVYLLRNDEGRRL